MHVTAQQLIRGSSALDRIKSELDQVTNLLFWLAHNNPKLWIRGRDLVSPHGWDFKTSFGDASDEDAIWEVWWAHGGVPASSRSGFRARCIFQAEDGYVQAYSTAHREEELPTKYGQQFIPVTEALGIDGIQFAWENLDLFVKGMMHDFPLTIAVEPYLRAAQRSL